MQRERHTVDQLFSNKMNMFTHKEKAMIEKYNSKITDYEEKKLECNDDDKKLLYEEKIHIYKEKIKKLEYKINSYFLENYNDLFHYFEIKKDIESNNNPKTLIHRFFDKNRNNELINHSEYKQCIEKYMRKNNFDIYSNEYWNPDENHHLCRKCNQG